MRQLLIDDLSVEERANIDNYLKRTVRPGLIEGMYWLDLPDDLFGEAQQGHGDCGPFYFGIEIGKDSVSFELLVRSQTNLHCSCIGYATEGQRSYLLKFIDRMLAEEMIKA